MLKEILISDLKVFRFDKNFEFKFGLFQKDLIEMKKRWKFEENQLLLTMMIRFLLINSIFSAVQRTFFLFNHFQRKKEYFSHWNSFFHSLE